MLVLCVCVTHSPGGEQPALEPAPARTGTAPTRAPAPAVVRRSVVALYIIFSLFNIPDNGQKAQVQVRRKDVEDMLWEVDRLRWDVMWEEALFFV